MDDNAVSAKAGKGLEVSRRTLALLPLGVGAVAMLGNQAAAHDLSERPSLEERAAIEDLFTAYVWSYDCSDVALFLSLFVDEDPLVVGMGKPHRGKPAMAEWFAYLLDIRDKENGLWLHQAAHHTYRRNGAGWLVYSYATHFVYDLTAKDYAVRSLGFFVSELVHVDGGFKFRRFSITHWDKAALPWSKPLPWAAADGLTA